MRVVHSEKGCELNWKSWGSLMTEGRDDTLVE